MLISLKMEADFSRGCVLSMIRPAFLLTLPHPAIRGWFYVSAACPVVLAGANLYSLLPYLVPSDKPQGGE
jgi:hypothetical protein